MIKNQNNTMFIKLMLYFVCGGLLLLFCLLIYRFCIGTLVANTINQLKANGLAYNELLSIQISVTFIVISVVTAFSQKSDVIYWEDAMHYKLVRPGVTNFCALSSFLFVDLLYSIGLVIAGNDFVYFTFLFSVLILMLLSYKMIEAFFMHDHIKKQLEKDYMNARNNRRNDRKKRDLYRDYKRMTIQNTISAIEDNNIELVCENISFLYRFNEKEDTDYLISCMIDNKKIFMLSSVIKHCRFIFSDDSEVDEFFNLCRDIINVSEDDTNFVKSIIRSMGEFIIYELTDNVNEKKHYEKCLAVFDLFLRSKGLDEVSDVIMNNYNKQVDGMYAKN